MGIIRGVKSKEQSLSAVENTPQQGTSEVSNLDYAAFEKSMNEGKIPTQSAPVADAESEPDSGTDEQEPAVEASEEQEQPKAKKADGGFQRRIKDLTREKYERDARIAELESKLAGNNPAAQPREKAASADAEPDAANYTDYKEYLRDLATYTIRQEREAEKAQERQNAAVEHAKTQLKTWEERAKKLAATHDDYEDVVASIEVDETRTVLAMRAALGSSDIGPQMLYHLGKNPKEIERITALPPEKALLELGKLEAKLSPKASSNQPPKVSKAAEPISRVGVRTVTPPKSLGDPSLDYKTFEKLANERLG